MNPLIDKIRAEIRDSGPIPFARFMESALYCPVYGYYEKEADTVGRRGDYYTSVSVGALFGELLALQFSLWLEPLGLPSPDHAPRPARDVRTGETPGAMMDEGIDVPVTRNKAPNWGSRLQLVEAGAHRAELAKDILSWLRDHRPALFDQIQYVIIEPSGQRQEWQHQTLRAFEAKLRWLGSIEELGPTHGIIFSNELLDSFPVHRLAWDTVEKTWFEWGVSWENESFCWTPLKLEQQGTASAVQPPRWSEEILATLPNGFVVEVCPAATSWWGQAARALQRGKLLTIDYGFTSDEMVARERAGGTLRSYRNHAVAGDVLADPGEQDLTAHVDFSNLCKIGEEAGLLTHGLFTQEQFLTRIAALVFRGEKEFGAWTSQRTRQFGTLTHPSHLGHNFRVLLQSSQAPNCGSV